MPSRRSRGSPSRNQATPFSYSAAAPFADADDSASVLTAFSAHSPRRSEYRITPSASIASMVGRAHLPFVGERPLNFHRPRPAPPVRPRHFFRGQKVDERLFFLVDTDAHQGKSANPRCCPGRRRDCRFWSDQAATREKPSLGSSAAGVVWGRRRPVWRRPKHPARWPRRP